VVRPGVTADDLARVIFVNALVVRETAATAPQAWRRVLAFSLGGLQAGATHPLPGSAG
jgi:hypothetical protein